MKSDIRTLLLKEALRQFDASGTDRATVASIRSAAGVSNGSFFHFFPSKDALCGALFLECLGAYHQALVNALADAPSADQGILRLVRAHMQWVSSSHSQAKFLFDHSEAHWVQAVAQQRQEENQALAAIVEPWREACVERGELRPMSRTMFVSQLIGPAQMFCRAWLAGRLTEDPMRQADVLADFALRAMRP